MAFGGQAAEPPSTPVMLSILAVFTLLSIVALIDAWRRPSRLLWGEKRWVWTLVILVPFGLGWAVYLLFGRLSEEDAQESHPNAHS